MLKAGVPIGVSSRGYGSTKSSKGGFDVVQEDYKLVTFDFVAEPADQTAYPNVFFEGAEIPLALQENEEVADKEKEKELEKKFAQKILDDPATSSLEGVREEFKRDLLDSLASFKQSVREQLEQELLSDPEVAGAKTALESIKAIVRPHILPEDAETLVKEKDDEIKALNKKISEQDLEIKEKNEIIETLSGAAKEAGYKYFLEKTLSDVEDAAIVRKMVGDVTQYESTDDIKEAVNAASEEISTRREEEKQNKAKALESEERLEAEKQELKDALQESIEITKRTQLLLYAERALTNHPKAAKIRRVLENANLSSKTDVDELIEGFETPTRSADDLSSVRDRVRHLVGGGRENLNESGDPARHASRGTNSNNNYNGLGVSLADIKKLSGMPGGGPN